MHRNSRLKYLVTIDREEWEPPRRWQVWRKHWWAMHTRRPELAAGIGRTVFEVCRDTGHARAAFDVPQLLDRDVLGSSWMEQSTWTKSISRGLRAITCLPGGGYVINDVFGVYELDEQGRVTRYVTSPDISDLHCALPNSDNSRLLLSNTGCEEVLEIDWQGEVLRRIDLPALFDLPPSRKWLDARARHVDARTMRFDHNRELFHVNWAEWLVEGEELIVSCHGPGVVAKIDVRTEGRPQVVDSWSYYPHCHGPTLDQLNSRLLVAVSKTDEVREICTRTGATVWRTPGIGYGKRVVALSDTCAVATDCNGKRLVEIDRQTGEIRWEAELPGLPYGVTVANG